MERSAMHFRCLDSARKHDLLNLRDNLEAVTELSDILSLSGIWRITGLCLQAGTAIPTTAARPLASACCDGKSSADLRHVHALGSRHGNLQPPSSSPCNMMPPMSPGLSSVRILGPVLAPSIIVMIFTNMLCICAWVYTFRSTAGLTAAAVL